MLSRVPAAFNISKTLPGIQFHDAPVVPETILNRFLDSVAVFKVIFHSSWNVSVLNGCGHPGKRVDVAAEHYIGLCERYRDLDDLFNNKNKDSFARSTETNRFPNPDFFGPEEDALVDFLSGIRQGS